MNRNSLKPLEFEGFSYGKFALEPAIEMTP